MTDLPEPTSERWQPLRCGLVEIFYYDEEIFHFHDGRLLLRGNNGTGKSKVMALTLPFLLDGQLLPSRVEPDGDSAKKMEWNLLVGEYQERLGYTWLEFGRRGESGPETFTVGCGLKAVKGRPVKPWYFTTPQRVGRDLFLVENGRSLSRDRLIQALGEQGHLHDRAYLYRRAIDEKLFQLGEQRYEALLDLLLQLRQPQLSKRPDPNRLSQALSDALPPLGRGLVGEIAEAYRSLDAYREEIQGLEETSRAVEAFLGHYRQYAGIAVRRRADGLTGSHAEYERIRGQLGRDRNELTEKHRAREALDVERQAQESRRSELEARQRTLEASEAMRSAEALHNADEQARQRRQHADVQGNQLARQQRQAEQAEARRQEAEQRDEAARARLQQHLAESGRAAEAAGLAAEHRRVAAEFATDPDALEAALRDLHRRCHEGVKHLEGRLRAVEHTESRFHQAEREVHREEETLANREDDLLEAGEARAGEARALCLAWRTYLGGLAHLVPVDPEALLAELEAWCEHMTGEGPAETGLGVARETLRDQLGQGLAALGRDVDAIGLDDEALSVERTRLESGGETAPPVPYTRGERVRQARPGAPLWQLVDFRDGMTAEARAGLEAALEASGLLDAWVMPDGAVLDADTWDSVLIPPSGGSGPAPARSLAAALHPDRPDEAPVERSVVERLLSAIALGESDSPAWVAEDGSWRLGPIRGQWHKAQAVYIGHAAREAARRQRLAEIARQREALAARRAELEAEMAQLALRREAADREWNGRPGNQALRDAHANEAALRRARDSQMDRLERAKETLDAAREILQSARSELFQAAEDLRLPAEREALARVAEALNDFRLAIGELSQALRGAQEAQQWHEERREETQAAREELQQAELDRAEAEEQALEAEVRRDTLRESMGAEVQELERQLEALRLARETLKREQRELDAQHGELVGKLGTLTERVENGERRLEEQGDRREQAIATFRTLMEEELLRVAAPQAFIEAEPPASWAPEPSVRLARAAAQATASLDASDENWHRHQRGLHEHIKHLTDTLSRGGHDCLAEARDDLLLVRIVFQGKRQDPDALGRQLTDEITQRQALLNARERELLENYLIDEVASHIQERITATERNVATMNRELEQRPTSTGMRLRMRWQALAEGESAAGLIAPAGLADVCQRLRRQALDAWSPEDRQVVGDFLRQRIEEARGNDEGGALQEILERALDYRFWHRFTVERYQNGQWRPAYGPASGGERALVITLPLFAAAASHYSSAHPLAPRLVMLDEVFAGIDDDARGKSMGLLAQFDLDAIMTSEREWGCYPDVPGLAIAQLVRREGVDAVHVTRWRWDGKRRLRDVSPVSQIREPMLEEEEEGDGGMDSLF